MWNSFQYTHDSWAQMKFDEVEKSMEFKKNANFYNLDKNLGEKTNKWNESED